MFILHLKSFKIRVRISFPVFLWAFIPLLFLGASCKDQNQNMVSVPIEIPEDMAYIPEGTFKFGTNDKMAYPDEGPAVEVEVTAFFMDKTEVTNAQFEKFVEATGYQTVAERAPDWEEIKAQLPSDTPKPHDSLLVPGSLVFVPPAHAVSLDDISQWWQWVPEAAWHSPEGPGSNITGLESHPVVHVAVEDARSYCEWAGGRLPTEVEWEWASRGGNQSQTYPWGDELQPGGAFMANTYQGVFPHTDEGKDGYTGTAPVKSYPPNSYGLYDMIGNVWELTADPYDAQRHQRLAGKLPSLESRPMVAGLAMEYVVKGGSYLCSDHYCVNYRSSARQSQAFDSGASNIGFRCIIDIIDYDVNAKTE